MDSYDILVIILSVFLAIFLLLGIIFMVYLIKVIKIIRHLSETAATVVDNASNVTANISKFVTPSIVGKYVFDAINKAIKHRKKGR